MRAFAAGLIAILMGCSPPAANAPATPAVATEAVTSQGAVDALTPLISAEIGAPVSLQATTVNVVDNWAYVEAAPKNADGSEIDWTRTNLASRYENGAMDTNGAVHALLRNENGSWTVLERVIAPTDVAWLDWAARHGAPPSVVTTPPPPTP